MNWKQKAMSKIKGNQKPESEFFKMVREENAKKVKDPKKPSKELSKKELLNRYLDIS